MTIEVEHSQKLGQFINDVAIKRELEEEIHDLQMNVPHQENWLSKIQLKGQIHKIQLEIDSMDNDQSVEYFLNVANILHQYEMPEHHVSIGDSYTNENNIKHFISQTQCHNKGELFKQYRSKVHDEPVEMQALNVYTCESCKVAKILLASDSVVVCPSCGQSETCFEATSAGMTYEQEINSEVNVSFAYKRINHFNEWLQQFQAKETTCIPEDSMTAIRLELKKNRILDVSKIDQKVVKTILKKLKLNKLYEHCAIITNMLSGAEPESLTPQLEERLRNMFRAIQLPFDKHKPRERSNFLSYSYCLYKFCELIEEDEILKLFPLLKSREKLYQQDKIWKNICIELDWQYISTV